MSNKKGFVLIETIVTITVLAASLLYVYSNFNNILIKEKNRIHYDDVAYIYRTYYLKDFFKNYELDFVLSLLNVDNPLIIIGCDYENENTENDHYQGMFGDSVNAQNICRSLTASLGVSKIAVGLKDLSYVEDCDEDSDKCLYLKNFTIEEQNYLKTLGIIDTSSEYIMIIEYIEADESSDSVKNYAWINI